MKVMFYVNAQEYKAFLEGQEVLAMNQPGINGVAVIAKIKEIKIIPAERGSAFSVKRIFN